jgi:hypothetical protein
MNITNVNTTPFISDIKENEKKFSFSPSPSTDYSDKWEIIFWSHCRSLITDAGINCRERTFKMRLQKNHTEYIIRGHFGNSTLRSFKYLFEHPLSQTVICDFLAEAKKMNNLKIDMSSIKELMFETINSIFITVYPQIKTSTEFQLNVNEKQLFEEIRAEGKRAFNEHSEMYENIGGKVQKTVEESIEESMKMGDELLLKAKELHQQSIEIEISRVSEHLSFKYPKID